MLSRADILYEARRWIGTAYQHQAAIRGIGCDCIGFVAGVALAIGVPEAREWRDDPALRNYSREPDADRLLEACDRLMVRIDRAQALPGDVLVMRFESGRERHFGYLTQSDPDYMIHAWAPAGRVAEHIVNRRWSERITRVYRFRGLA